MSMNRFFLALAVVGTLVLAGCAGSDSGANSKNAAREAKRLGGAGGFVGETYAGSVDVDRSPAIDFDWSKVVLSDHGAPGLHAVRSIHVSGPGLQKVSFDPMVAGKDPTAYDSGYIAIDTWDNGKEFYACVAHFAGNGGADIVDLTDPTSMKVIGHIDSGALNSDCQFTDDGNYLFLGAYLGADQTSNGVAQIRQNFRAIPVAGFYDLLSNGVSVWDMHDKANPKFMLFKDTPTPFHNLYTVTINNTYWLLQTYAPNNVWKFDPKGGGSLTIVSHTSSMVHDMTVSRHPITGDWLLYTGKGSGMAIINFNDPTNPVDLGEWAAEKGATGWHEQEVIPQLVDGHALVIVAGETGGGNTLPYGVIDVTDPTNPTLLSTWIVPGNPSNRYPENFYTFSPHEIGTWNGYVTVGNYHAGAWLFDVGSLDRMMNPVTIGQFFGDEEPAMRGAPQNPPFAFNPDHWGSYFDSRGYVVTADWGSGLYMLKFDKTGTWLPTPPAE